MGSTGSNHLLYLAKTYTPISYSGHFMKLTCFLLHNSLFQLLVWRTNRTSMYLHFLPFLVFLDLACERNVSSTKWPSGIVLKPNMSTTNLKDMASIWYNPELFIFLKLIQAECTLFTKVMFAFPLNHPCFYSLKWM